MKKLLMMGLVSLLGFGPVVAFANFTPFTTIAMAEKYCPAIDGLTFTPNNSTPNSAGTVTGENVLEFSKTNAIAPANMDAKNIIQGVAFREAGGNYGYNSNGRITCLYSYPNFVGGSYALAIRSTTSK